jgi:hypothetical protein
MHISAPYLKSIDTIDNKRISKIIKDSGYNKIVSLEMRNPNDKIARKRCIELFAQYYT